MVHISLLIESYRSASYYDLLYFLYFLSQISLSSLECRSSWSLIGIVQINFFFFMFIIWNINGVFTGDACTGDVVMFEQNVYEM